MCLGESWKREGRESEVFDEEWLEDVQEEGR